MFVVAFVLFYCSKYFILFYTHVDDSIDVAFCQLGGSRPGCAAVQSTNVAMSLNLGRDNLYILTGVPRLRYELEVGTL